MLSGRQMGLDIVRSMRPLIGRVRGEVFENYWYRIFGWNHLVTVLNSYLGKFAEFWLQFNMSYLMTFKWYSKLRGWYMQWKVGYIDRHRQRYLESFPVEFSENKFKFEPQM